MTEPYDVFVIGGGINGVSIARDAAGRGYSVALCEMNDFASGTSSKATKLVHGGLRYLEYYEFRLVAEALAEREVLWAEAPHIIWPLRFVLPHHRGLRPRFVLRLGLFLYDHLGGRKLLPATRSLDLRKDIVGQPLKSSFKKGFEYSDCWVDDARFVVLNARDAADRGADIRSRTKVIAIARENGLWAITTSGPEGTKMDTARLVVNAAGPWVDQVINGVMRQNGKRSVRLVKGSHLVVKKLYDHDRCYIFQNGDGRIIFAIPYEDDFTLIGTTDQDFDGDMDGVSASDAEIDYLLASAGEYFEKAVTRADLVWSYAGVRPLFDDGASDAQEATRDYVLKIDGDASSGAIVHVFGGKLTTSRRLAESALAKIETILGAKGNSWTKTSTLPGGDFHVRQLAAERQRLIDQFPHMPPAMLSRMMRQYGTMTYRLLDGAGSVPDLGEHFGADLFSKEVDYLMDNEWARASDDVLWRRTKLGLRIGGAVAARLEAYMLARAGRRSTVVDADTADA